MSNIPEPTLYKNVKELHNQGTPEEQTRASGYFGKQKLETVVGYNDLSYETTIPTNRKGNSLIVIGKDRIPRAGWNFKKDPDGRSQGYANVSAGHCSSIDLIAGLGGIETNPSLSYTPWVMRDSARVYIADMTDADDVFLINKFADATKTDGYYSNDFGKSAVGINADHVRITANECVKIVTGVKLQNSKQKGLDYIAQAGGIYLIAGNDDSDIQPIPKGDNLIDFSKAIIKNMNDTISTVTDLTNTVMSLANDIMNHYHISPFRPGGTPLPTDIGGVSCGVGLDATFDTTEILLDRLTKLNFSMAQMEQKYLNPAVAMGSGQGQTRPNGKYILSRRNKTN